MNILPGIDTAIDAFSAFGNYTMNKNAYEHNRDMAKRQYTWAVQDMKRAGLNPVLAVTGGFKVGGPAASGASPFPQKSSLSEKAVAIASAKKLHADAQLSGNQAIESQARTEGQRLMNQALEFDLKKKGTTSSWWSDIGEGSRVLRNWGIEKAKDVYEWFGSPEGSKKWWNEVKEWGGRGGRHKHQTPGKGKNVERPPDGYIQGKQGRYYIYRD